MSYICSDLTLSPSSNLGYFLITNWEPPNIWMDTQPGRGTTVNSQRNLVLCLVAK